MGKQVRNMKIFAALFGAILAQGTGYDPVADPADPTAADPTPTPTEAPTPAPTEPYTGHSWPGRMYGDENKISNCGSQKPLENNIVNGTCTIDFNGRTPAHVSIPGCFTEGTGMTQVICNGVDGVTNPASLDVVVFWEQELNADQDDVDNSTCGTADDITAINCVDNSAEPSRAMFDNISNNFHAGATRMTHNVQIFGAAGSTSYTHDMRDMQGEAANVYNATCGMCTTTTFDGSTVTIEANKDASQSTLITVQIDSDSAMSPHTSTIVSN